MQNRTKEMKIALSAIVAVAVLYFGIQFLKGINMFKASNYYYVEFDNVGGLTLSSPVYADGFAIGVVRDIAYDYAHPGHVVVEFSAEEKFRLPEGSRGEIVTEMLGTTKMNLLLCKENPRMVAPGDTIQGRLNSGLLDGADALMPALEGILPRIDTMLCNINLLLGSPALQQTLQNAEHITDNLTATTTQLNALLNRDIPHLSNNLQSITDNFTVISDNLKEVDYAATLQKLDETIANIQAITLQLNSNETAIGLLFNDTALYENLNAAAANAASLLEDLQSHPKRYVQISLFGKQEK